MWIAQQIFIVISTADASNTANAHLITIAPLASYVIRSAYVNSPLDASQTLIVLLDFSVQLTASATSSLRVRNIGTAPMATAVMKTTSVNS